MPENKWTLNTLPHSSPDVLIEERKVTFTVTIHPNFLDTLLENVSCLPKILRILSYILRFIFNSRHSENKRSGFLTTLELREALFMLVKRVQNISFSQEIAQVTNREPISKIIRKLHPFLDDKGLLRVGGRLTYAKLNYDKKHPVLLPRSHRLTTLIIESTHKKYLHPGAQTLQYLLMQQFWILSAKRAIRQVLSKCHTCWKLNPTSTQPPMGNLPALRISQVKPFSCTGVDYAGPYLITMSQTRGAKTLKAYICLFVCYATKALHLELASDLSTEAFLAALRRFIARRGRCTRLHSDMGTNFVGAAKYIKQCFSEAAEAESLEWQFNPPSAPHFGGLWEAGVKSVKTHLARVLGEQILTYEQLHTVLVQIEAVLNSRPLCPLSSDPHDLSVLTPGHFLTLEPLTALPDPELKEVSLGRLTRWQLLQRLHQDFWSRWKNEYLHTLQQRGKWTSPSTSIAPGTLVVIKNDNLPPLRWQLGREEQIHPGADGVTRVVTLRTAQGLLKRPVVKVCPLPNTEIQ